MQVSVLMLFLRLKAFTIDAGLVSKEQTITDLWEPFALEYDDSPQGSDVMFCRLCVETVCE